MAKCGGWIMGEWLTRRKMRLAVVVSENLLDRALNPTHDDQLWASDITYHLLQERLVVPGHAGLFIRPPCGGLVLRQTDDKLIGDTSLEDRHYLTRGLARSYASFRPSVSVRLPGVSIAIKQHGIIMFHEPQVQLLG